jgi:drug/metabolite transporter (DMT)-like permease
LKPKHWIIFILLGAIWSASFLWIKIGVQELGPMNLVLLRAFFGALTAGGLALIFRAPFPRTRDALTTLAILGLTNIVIPIVLISWGEQTIDSAVASILNATVPLFTIFIAHFSLKDDKMTLPKVAGLVVGFIGIIVLLSQDLLKSAQSSVIGQAAVIVACIFYAWSAVFIRKRTVDVHMLWRGALPLISATIILGILTPFVEGPIRLPTLPLTWIAVFWLGILGSGFAFIMAFYLIHEIGPTRSTLVTYIFPPGGLLLGVIFLNEPLSWQLLAGAALIISSIVVVNWSPQKS